MIGQSYLDFLLRMKEPYPYNTGAHHDELGFLVSARGSTGTTEITTDGVTFNAFTPLPIGLSNYCMVALDGDDGEFFVGGGDYWKLDGNNGRSLKSRRAFIYRDNQWVEVAQMPTARNCKRAYLEMQSETS